MHRLLSILMVLVLVGCRVKVSEENDKKIPALSEQDRLEVLNVREDVSSTIYVNHFEHDGVRYICFSKWNQENTQFEIDIAYYLQQGDTASFAGRTWVAITPPNIEIIDRKLPTVE